MATCPVCNQELTAAGAEDEAEVEGCDPDRVIEFETGETLDPIPFGDAEWDESYDERVARLNEEIENGGRGRLGPDDIRSEREWFLNLFPDEAVYQERCCGDCGAKIGEYHHPGCDWEECPRCADQYFACGCHSDEDEFRLFGHVESVRNQSEV